MRRAVRDDELLQLLEGLIYVSNISYSELGIEECTSRMNLRLRVLHIPIHMFVCYLASRKVCLHYRI